MYMSLSQTMVITVQLEWKPLGWFLCYDVFNSYRGFHAVSGEHRFVPKHPIFRDNC